MSAGTAWLVILLAGAGSYLLRIAAVVARSRFTPPDWVERASAWVMPAAFAGLAAGSLSQRLGIEYARRHPERVSRLILVGAYARGRPRRARTEEQRQEYEMERELIRIGWGRDEHSFRLFFSSTFMPDVPPHLWTDFAELLRRTTSAENALRIFEACAAIDVTDATKELDLPTLILHGREELRIPFSQSVELASRIRGSRLVPLDTRNHLLLPDEQAWGHLMREIDAFLAEDDGS